MLGKLNRISTLHLITRTAIDRTKYNLKNNQSEEFLSIHEQTKKEWKDQWIPLQK